jgi:hypothetical protein
MCHLCRDAGIKHRTTGRKICAATKLHCAKGKGTDVFHVPKLSRQGGRENPHPIKKPAACLVFFPNILCEVTLA